MTIKVLKRNVKPTDSQLQQYQSNRKSFISRSPSGLRYNHLVILSDADSDG